MTNEAEMMREALEPCPFCGARSGVIHPLPGPGLYALRNDSPYFGHCDCCGADGPGADNPAAALTAWSTRAERVGVAGVAGPVSQDENGDWSAEIQTVGGHGLMATVYGETRDDAEALRSTFLAALQQGTCHDD